MNTFSGDRPHTLAAYQAPRPRLSLTHGNWPALGATLVAVVLLMTFIQITRSHVQQSEVRKRATAAQLDRMWRCNLLPTIAARADCRASIRAEGLPAVASSR